MTYVAKEDGDDADFVAEVGAVLAGLAKIYRPPELIVIKIDNWFGSRWLRFSGKVLGALGVWKTQLTVPPFVPSRVVWQRRFLAPSYDGSPSGTPIHIAAAGSQALSRRLSGIAPGAALAWFTGNTAANGRGAMMCYVPTEGSYWAWYAGFSSDGLWDSAELKGISGGELSTLSTSRPGAV